jgi:hypothetical protein
MVRMAYVCLFPLALAASGCESISLIKRGDPLARDDSRRGGYRDREPGRDPGGWSSGEREPPRAEIVGTVQRVDSNRQEIQLRTTEGQLLRIRYDLSTRVQQRDRDLRVDELRYGDLVRVELGADLQGERYAQLIRLNDRPELGSSRW